MHLRNFVDSFRRFLSPCRGRDRKPIGDREVPDAMMPAWGYTAEFSGFSVARQAAFDSIGSPYTDSGFGPAGLGAPVYPFRIPR